MIRFTSFRSRLLLAFISLSVLSIFAVLMVSVSIQNGYIESRSKAQLVTTLSLAKNQIDFWIDEGMSVLEEIGMHNASEFDERQSAAGTWAKGRLQTDVI
ncbi:MAG: hypothetical protein WCL50_18225, partial [Spirochaetota bacterium]